MTGPASVSGRPARRWGLLAVQLALTVLVTWFIADRLGLDLGALARLDPERWRPDGILLALSCLLLLAGYVVSAAVWGRMVRDLGGPHLPVGAAVGIFLVANLGRYVPGKVWQIAGLALLARRRGVPARVATGAAVLGQGVALAAATLVGAAALVGTGPSVRTWSTVLLGGLVAAVLVALLPPVHRRLVAVWFRLSRQEPPEREPGPGVVAGWLALYIANWGVYACSFWVLARAFSLPGSPLQVGPAFAAAYVLGYLAVFAPAGAGVREVALAGLLVPVVGTAAAPLAVIARIWTTAVEVVPAALLWARITGRDGGAGEAHPPAEPADAREAHRG